MHRKASRPGNQCIRRYRGWSPFPADTNYKFDKDDKEVVASFWLYTDYAPFRDLDLLRTAYSNAGRWVNPTGVQSVIMRKERLTNTRSTFPEGFLWYTFDCLAQGCLILQQGGIDAPDPNWRQIVHCDLKPPNGMPRPILWASTFN